MKYLYYYYFSNALLKSRHRGEREQRRLEHTRNEGNCAFGAPAFAVVPSRGGTSGGTPGTRLSPIHSPAFGGPDVPSPSEGPSWEREFPSPSLGVHVQGPFCGQDGRSLPPGALLAGRKPPPPHTTSWRRSVLICRTCTPKSFRALPLRTELQSASCANKTFRWKLTRKQMLLIGIARTMGLKRHTVPIKRILGAFLTPRVGEPSGVTFWSS